MAQGTQGTAFAYKRLLLSPLPFPFPFALPVGICCLLLLSPWTATTPDQPRFAVDWSVICPMVARDLPGISPELLYTSQWCARCAFGTVGTMVVPSVPGVPEISPCGARWSLLGGVVC